VVSEGGLRGARVLVGAFSIEGDSFVPGVTGLADFHGQAWAVGAGVDRECVGPTSELAGAWDVLVAAGVVPVGTVGARSSPGPRVAADVFDRVCQAVWDGCGPALAGVYLMLHGSALAEGDDDPEGTLLRGVRERVGAGVPIAISLDLHAYLTEAMIGSVDIVTAYRTCPHVDLYRTGRQAAELLVRAMAGAVTPVCRRVRVPMITPPELHDTGRDPFARLQGLCTEVEGRPGVLAAGLLTTQPWLDVPELGWSAVVTADGDAALAADVAGRLAQEAWAAREELFATSAVPLAEAVSAALTEPGPMVVADLGDATNGGSYGDSTELLRFLCARQAAGLPAGPAALTVTDPAAVAHAAAAGVGGKVSVSVGTGPVGQFNERTLLTGTVEKLWQGEIVYTHPAAEGLLDSPGEVAVLRVGEVIVILHSRPVRVIDPAIYDAVGIDLAELQIVQAKSHVSYRAGFDPFTRGSVPANTGGPTTADFPTLPFTRRPRPMLPFEETTWQRPTP